MLDGLVACGGEIGRHAVACLRLGGRLRQTGEPVAPGPHRALVHGHHQVVRRQTGGAVQRRVLQSQDGVRTHTSRKICIQKWGRSTLPQRFKLHVTLVARATVRLD